jgi:hypothetical protein
LRQPVQRLRSEHHIDIRGTAHDCRAFLAGHAAADADDQVGLCLLQLAHAAEIVEHAFLRFFAHRAGIEKNDVGFRSVERQREAVGGGEHVGHLVRVVLVHLTAEGADIEFSGHELPTRHGAPGAGFSVVEKGRGL